MKPCLLRIKQTSRPDRTRSLANANVESSDVYLAVSTLSDFRIARGLEEQLDGLHQISAGFLNRVPLTGYIDLRTQCHKAVALTLDYCRQVLYCHRAKAWLA